MPFRMQRPCALCLVSCVVWSCCDSLSVGRQVFDQCDCALAKAKYTPELEEIRAWRAAADAQLRVSARLGIELRQMGQQ